MYKKRKALLIFFGVMSIGCLFLLPHLKFAFNFEQFFPQGDPDLEFFQDFIKEFESDDNFLLVAFENKPDVFEPEFLRTVQTFSRATAKEVPYVKQVQSLPDFKYPVMTPFGPSSIPALHLDDPVQLEKDKARLLSDERILYTLLNKEATATVVVIKTEENVYLEESNEMMAGIDSLLAISGLEKYHMLGRPYFQAELTVIQIKEIILSTVISGVLISIIMILLFRRWVSIMIALGSIGIGLLIFMGLLSLLGRELSLMAALYPVLMLIVGTSDVIHIMTKYLDELKRGKDKQSAMRITVRQIGMATMLTSLTTAAGFATLFTSKIIPIQDFGLNSAIGVILAYVVVIGFTCPLLTFFDKDQLISDHKKKDLWGNMLSKAYAYSIRGKKQIYILSLILLVVFAYGISKVHTNYDMVNNLPRKAKITEDFMYFEKQFAGFRPLELAGTIQEGYDIYDYEVMSAIDKTEKHLRGLDEIQTAMSMATVVSSVNQMKNSNNPDFYKMPSKEAYPRIKRLVSRIPNSGTEILISKDKRKTRISTKVKDIGAQNIKQLNSEVDEWISNNIDPDVITFKQTGTGMLLDKNSEFVKDSLIQGLLIALLIVSVLMGLLFKNFKMLFLALVPNVIPLLFAAALIGYTGVALEAGVSIVFAIIFGIAVDDTIHFLSKYKLAKDQYGGDQEKAMEVTFQECGKAIIFTTIILFFGFLVLLFSNNQPSQVIGMLISVTLLSALVADLTILPVLMRKFDI